jgi:two-component system LytT family response regulator
MPGGDGFEVLEQLGARVPPAVIFVTAYDEYAIQAFDSNAVDYLLKPIQPQRFDLAIQRASERLRHKPVPRRFAVRVGGRIRLVTDEEVGWMESAGNYVRLHTAAGRLPLRAAMKDLEATLDPARFLRIHRSIIVNLSAVAHLEPEGDGEYTVVLKSGERLGSSRSYGEKLRSLFA